MRLIDADEAYKILTDYYHQRTEIQHKALKEAIERVPTIEAISTDEHAEIVGRLTAKFAEEIKNYAPIRHGHWSRKLDTRFGPMLNDLIICSVCNIAFSTENMNRRSYCPNCGAKMDGGNT